MTAKTNPVNPDVPTPPQPNREEGANVEGDDINVPMVAVYVAFFAILLVLIVALLEAAFYNADRAELARKQVAQGAPQTPLGIMHAEHHEELTKPGLNPRLSTEKIQVMRTDIDSAMAKTITTYEARK